MSDTDTISPGAAALELRLSPRTVARWADEGRFGETTTTDGGHRRLKTAEVRRVASELREKRLAALGGA